MKYSELDIQKLINIKMDVIYNNTTNEEQDVIVDKFFHHYRSEGFPYYNMTDIEIMFEVQRMINFNVDSLRIENYPNTLQQVMHGLNVANNFHPQMWSVQCRDRLSPMQVYSDDKTFKKALFKRFKMDDSKMQPFVVRKSLKIFSGAQSVSNFRPTIAKYFYMKYAPKNGKVLDPCVGYGGRLIGAFVSHIGEYVGTDPSSEAMDGNLKLYDKMNSLIKKRRNKFFDYEENIMDIKLHQIPFEDSEYEPESFDFVFTSPPYFNVEKYSNEPTQSWKRYQTYKDWSEKFLLIFIRKCFLYLKKGSYFALNIAGGEITEDAKKYAAEVGFKLVKTYHMRLSQICGKGIDKNEIKFKHEPIFVFKKL